MAALADALVVVAALWAASRARGWGVGAAMWRVGLGLVVIASAIGTVRLAGVGSLAGIHNQTSSWATFVGMPLMSAGLIVRLYGTFSRWVIAGVALAVTAVWLSGNGQWHGIAREDLFHLLFASALVCFGQAYQRR